MKLENIKATIRLEIPDIRLNKKEVNDDLINMHKIMKLSGCSIKEMREELNCNS